MKWIEERFGATTRIRLVPDDYKVEEKDIPQKDLTTGGASLISMGISKEDFEKIFKTKEKRQKKDTQRKYHKSGMMKAKK